MDWTFDTKRPALIPKGNTEAFTLSAGYMEPVEPLYMKLREWANQYQLDRVKPKVEISVEFYIGG